MPKPKTLDVKTLKGFLPYKGTPKICADFDKAIQHRVTASKADPKIDVAMLDKLDKHFANKD